MPGLLLFFGNGWLLALPLPLSADTVLRITTLTAGYICLFMAGLWISRLLRTGLLEDVFNVKNESFMRETELKENEYSVSLRARFWFRGRAHGGWINPANPFRATMVLGTSGSGKSYAIINQYIKQTIERGYSLFLYDSRYPDLSEIAYNRLLAHLDDYKVKPKFYMINFDNPRESHRCNPIHPDFMTDISDTYESTYTIMLNLGRTWISKQDNLLVESPVILSASIIWYLRICKNGKYCTFPHVIEFLSHKYADIFPTLTPCPELEDYLSPFMDVWKSSTVGQLQRQIASARIPLFRVISPALCWVMMVDDFTLDINNPEESRVLIVGNNPDRQDIYGTALRLYDSRIVKLINKKKWLKSAVIINELPTIYMRGLGNFITTARSNEVAVVLDFQDFSQLKHDYGDKEPAVIYSTVDNVFVGQVVAGTTETLPERFDEVSQKRQNVTINRNETFVSINTQVDSPIPASEISNLTQGMFVEAVADNFDKRIEQKIFHTEIVVDNEQVKRETAHYVKIPQIIDFTDKDGNDTMRQQIDANYYHIKDEVRQVATNEIERIKADPELSHLIKDK